LKRAARALFKVPLGIMESMRIIGEFRPDLIIGVGGYASGPPVAAGWLTGRPIVLQEQNLLPGVANRLMAPLARRVYVSFPESASRFGQKKARLVGNPVRQEIREAASRSPRAETDRLTVLILGGSQGAKSINSAVIDALDHLARPEKVCFIHQTGTADEARVQAAYARTGIDAECRAFFHDVGPILSRADLVICRAGATTVAELTAIGKAIIFIPFPFAADDHQAKNARSLARRGAAEMILESELTGSGLAGRIDAHIRNPEGLAELARRSRAFGRPEAAAAIVDDCLKLLEGKD
jgi:UDP-N-acetylglucosamine--N-acetylmuramyl-(pentapeptide) pyrophosphoryl-undecaprenol N-acetylglucosamine transferase